MRQLLLKPALHLFADCKTFVEEFQIGAGDMILTNKFIYEPHFGSLSLGADVIHQELYGEGEPSDEMAEAICADVKKRGEAKRIVAIGGGTVIDLAKLCALKHVFPVCDLFDRKLPIAKDKGLVLIPTTCGTGSEATNISILELKARRAKFGLVADELYADHAILMPKLLEGLPYKVFAASSIDALIHAMESSVSPRATPYTKLFGHEAIRLILKGYLDIARNGESARTPHLGDFLLASDYAGIAFGNAGTGAVHAMSYPLGGQYHVPHGDANYAMFIKVFERYSAKGPNAVLAETLAVVARCLECGEGKALSALASLLERILPFKPLREYGVADSDLSGFTENVMTKQGRLMANNCVPLDADDVLSIYRKVF